MRSAYKERENNDIIITEKQTNKKKMEQRGKKNRSQNLNVHVCAEGT